MYQDVVGCCFVECLFIEEWGSSFDEVCLGFSIQFYLVLGVWIGYEIERYGYKKD